METDNECVNCPSWLKETCWKQLSLSPGERNLLERGAAVPEALARQLQQICPQKEHLGAGVNAARGLRSRMGRSAVPPGPGSEVGTETVIAPAFRWDEVARDRVTATAPPGAPGWILRVQETGHRIALPPEGTLTLGRLHPLSGHAPDVDLTYDDRQKSVSRFHARIIGRRGEFLVEEWEGTSGVWLNGHRLSSQQQGRLRAGDMLSVGKCLLAFEEAPQLWTDFPATAKYVLYATFSGREYPLSDTGELLVGRADPQQGYFPSIDLSQEGEAALMVSRRHALLRRDAAGWQVSDLGSTNKTKINGVPVSSRSWATLSPGQHLWLGGFGLVLEIRRE